MLQSLILVDALTSVIERKKREKRPRAFISGQTHTISSAVLGFSQLLGAIKGCFKVSP
jgi:hypothetical protein